MKKYHGRVKKKEARDPVGTEQRLITTGEAATHCQVSLPALRRWIRDGRLRAFQTPGKHARIEVSEFRRFLKECGMPPYPWADAAGPPRVLVVEDVPEVLQLLTRLVAAHPRRPTVETAVDGYDALIKVGIFKPSFLILDVIMPKLDGLEVCRRLRANPETRDIRILAVTGRTDMVERVIAAGADACITKPFDFDLVNRELDQFLGASEHADPVSAERSR
jgi:two-component system response regulator VicR